MAKEPKFMKSESPIKAYLGATPEVSEQKATANAPQKVNETAVQPVVTAQQNAPVQQTVPVQQVVPVQPAAPVQQVPPVQAPTYTDVVVSAVQPETALIRPKHEGYSKRLNLLIQPSVYISLCNESIAQDVSLNKLINQILREHCQQKQQQ